MEQSELPVFPLPLPPNPPPDQYGWEEQQSDTSGINQRDTFLGRRCCIVCGEASVDVLQHCHIIGSSEPDLWIELKHRNWIPTRTKAHPSHEPRNGMLLCFHHHILFDRYDFFIRYVPGSRRFILVNYSNIPMLEQFHGKSIALDIQHRHVPFPSLFIIHEMRVRGFHPFEPISRLVRADSPWQDWMSSDGVIDNESGFFRRDMPEDDREKKRLSGSMQLQRQSTIQAPSSGEQSLVLDTNTITAILGATRALPLWKACQMEGTSWDGTAEENIEKYVISIGIDRQVLVLSL